jgi:p-hydroxybenzoate 3-monooxygenase
MDVQIAIVGAGPAGLFLSHLLDQAGISCVVLENRSRAYIEARTRAAVLEQRTMDLMEHLGLGARMWQDGIPQEGIELRFARTRYRVPLSEMTNGAIMMFYSQQEVVKDLLAARLAKGGEVIFEATDAVIRDIDSARPSVLYVKDGTERTVTCDFVVGCDGFHGVSRQSMPSGMIKEFNQELPFAWLGLLANVPPSTKEVIFARHTNGFAMHSIRPGGVSRLYLQVAPSERIENWSDDRIWSELHERLAIDEDWSLAEGPIVDKSVIPLHSFVAEPMQHGRLFLAGDAAHIVPPVAAKGLNLAVADVLQLSRGFTSYYKDGNKQELSAYTSVALERIWHTMYFSWDMSEMMHKMNDNMYQDRIQLAKLRYIRNSPHFAKAFCDSYFGLTHA